MLSFTSAEITDLLDSYVELIPVPIQTISFMEYINVQKAQQQTLTNPPPRTWR